MALNTNNIQYANPYVSIYVNTYEDVLKWLYMKTRKRLGENLVRKLSKFGGFSYGLTLPIDVIRKFKWRERQKLQLTVDEKKKRIIIEDWEK